MTKQVNIDAPTLSARQLLDAGQRVLNAEHRLKEAAKVGTLRAGSTGVVLDGGNTLGKCPRIAHLRNLGVDFEADLDTHLMFAAGVSNEDAWVSRLEKSWIGKVLREEDIPISWVTSNGMAVTGRPDIVLAGSDGVLRLGLELKLVSAFWTARSVHYNLQPKPDHLAQACHYMWQLNTPFKLVYTSRVRWAIQWFAESFNDKPDIEYNDKGKPKAILPFVREYDLRLTDGRLQYTTEGIDGWVDTIITVAGIQKFYDVVSQMAGTKQLGARPANTDAVGERTFSPCDYCVLSDICDKYEDHYDLWLDNARLRSLGIIS